MSKTLSQPTPLEVSGAPWGTPPEGPFPQHVPRIKSWPLSAPCSTRELTMHRAATLTETDSPVRREAGVPGCEQWGARTFTSKEKYPPPAVAQKFVGHREKVFISFRHIPWNKSTGGQILNPSHEKGSCPGKETGTLHQDALRAGDAAVGAGAAPSLAKCRMGTVLRCPGQVCGEH